MSRQRMTSLPKIAVIIPAFDEENAITKVLHDIPRDVINEIIVINNNSTDATPENARSMGATVLHESRQGYGFACMKGIDYLKSRSKKPEIVVFLDADYSDYPEEMLSLIKPIIEEDYDLVLGSRLLGYREPRAMSRIHISGNCLAVTFIKLLYGVRFTDLGPFRAIVFDKLLELDMNEKTYGWTAEMQIKAVKHNMRICEIPVTYRVRIGKSKISGTLKGTILAGYSIMAAILRYR